MGKAYQIRDQEMPYFSDNPSGGMGRCVFKRTSRKKMF